MWRAAPGLIFLLLAALFFLVMTQQEPARQSTGMTGEKAPLLQAEPLFPDSVMPNIQAAALHGPVLVNFFASWCTPCLAEHPYISLLAKDESLNVIGIAWNDKPDTVREWLEKHGNPYSFAGLDSDGRTAFAYGVSGMPESFLINRSGVVSYAIRGPITAEKIRDEILPQLGK